METKYPDGRSFAFEDGLAYQEFVGIKAKQYVGVDLHFFKTREGQLYGETAEGYEVKYDARMKKTGNVYIETAEKSKASRESYYPSGINRADNTKWIWIGDYKNAFLFNKTFLKEFITNSNLKTVRTPTSEGVLISCNTAKKICDKFFEFKLYGIYKNGNC